MELQWIEEKAAYMQDSPMTYCIHRNQHWTRTRLHSSPAKPAVNPPKNVCLNSPEPLPFKTTATFNKPFSEPLSTIMTYGTCWQRSSQVVANFFLRLEQLEIECCRPSNVNWVGSYFFYLIYQYKKEYFEEIHHSVLAHGQFYFLCVAVCCQKHPRVCTQQYSQLQGIPLQLQSLGTRITMQLHRKNRL